MIHAVVQALEEGLSKQFPVNLFLVNQTGHLVWVNDNLLQLSEVKHFSELKGKHIRHFGHASWETTKQVIKTRQRVTLYEKIQGKTFFVMKIPYVKASFRGVLGFSLDITALEQAREAKDEFVRNMAHDIRTPLAGIIGLASLQASGELTSLPQVQAYGQMIQSASEQLLALLNAVLEIISSQENARLPKCESINLTELAEALQALIKPALIHKGLAFHLIIDPTLTRIQGDPMQLKQMLTNVLSNAVKFTEHGEIVFSIRHLANDNQTAQIEFSVRDTGIGMTEADQAQIFEPFFKVKPSGESSHYTGIGKGLFLVKQAVEQMKGSITVHSELGQGSTFRILLPDIVER